MTEARRCRLCGRLIDVDHDAFGRVAYEMQRQAAGTQHPVPYEDLPQDARAIWQLVAAAVLHATYKSE